MTVLNGLDGCMEMKIWMNRSKEGEKGGINGWIDIWVDGRIMC